MMLFHYKKYPKRLDLNQENKIKTKDPVFYKDRRFLLQWESRYHRGSPQEEAGLQERSSGGGEGAKVFDYKTKKFVACNEDGKNK